MLTSAWDDTKPTDSEISLLETEHTVRRRRKKWYSPNRLFYWFLDWRFFRSVHKKKTLNDAREDAIHDWGFVQGVGSGAVLLACVLVVLNVFVGSAVLLTWLTLVFNIMIYGLWAVVVIRWVLAGVRRLRRKSSS